MEVPMQRHNDVTLSGKALVAVGKLADWLFLEDGGPRIRTALFLEPGKDDIEGPTTASLIAEVAAERTGVRIRHVERPKSFHDVETFVDDLGPFLKEGGILHLDFGDLGVDTEKYAMHLLEGIRESFAGRPGRLLIIAETSLSQVTSPSARLRFDSIEPMETERPGLSPAPLAR
jgi:hypothetical protein